MCQNSCVHFLSAGGGLGGTRRGGPDVNVKISGRDDADRDRFRDADPRDRGLSIGEDRRDRGDRDRYFNCTLN